MSHLGSLLSTSGETFQGPAINANNRKGRDETVMFTYMNDRLLSGRPVASHAVNGVSLWVYEVNIDML